MALVSADKAVLSRNYFIMKVMLLEPPKKLSKTNLAFFLTR